MGAMIKTNIPGPSMYSPGACPRRVGIYFPGGHVLLFGIIKKKFQAPACTHRVLALAGQAFTSVGIYFPARHALLFALIKTKFPGPSMYSPGTCTRRVCIYFRRHLLSG